MRVVVNTATMEGSMKAGRRPRGEDGLERLLESFRPRARAIVSSYRIPEEDGDDLLQETLLTFLHKRDQIYKPEAWLATESCSKSATEWPSFDRK